MAKNKHFENGSNFAKVWLKRKTKQVYKDSKNGASKGDEYDMFIGHLDMGGGKMLQIAFYADQAPVEVNGEEFFVIKCNKWKAKNRTSSSSRGKSAW